MRNVRRRPAFVAVGLVTVLALAGAGTAAADATASNGSIATTAASIKQSKPEPEPSPSDSLNPADRALLARQEPLVKAADRLQPLLHKEIGFAGLVLAAERSGITLYWKGAVPRSITDEIDRIHKQWASAVRITVSPAEYSLDQLNAEASRLVTTRLPYGRLVAVGPLSDGSGLRVRVELDGSHTSPPPIGSPVHLDVETGPAPAPSSRWSDAPPFWGGAVAQRPAEELGFVISCTSGFGVRSGLHQYLMTAAHCGSVGDFWTTPAVVAVGTTTFDDNSHETMLIEVSAAGPRIYDGGTDPTGGGAGEINKSVAQYGTNYVGLYVCQSGAFSGTRCGIRVTQTNVTYYLESVWVTSGVIAEKDDRTNAAGHGDSGGPVMWPTANDQVVGVGILSAIDLNTLVPCTGVIEAGRQCAWRMFYENLQTALAVSGTQLMTSIP